MDNSLLPASFLQSQSAKLCNPPDRWSTFWSLHAMSLWNLLHPASWCNPRFFGVDCRLLQCRRSVVPSKITLPFIFLGYNNWFTLILDTPNHEFSGGSNKFRGIVLNIRGYSKEWSANDLYIFRSLAINYARQQGMSENRENCKETGWALIGAHPEVSTYQPIFGNFASEALSNSSG